MELYLQMGHGMQRMCGELIQHWGKGNVILSPVNTVPSKIVALSKQYQKNGGGVLFDPQLYYPKDGADKLKLYEYWPDNDVSITDTPMHQKICRDILPLMSRSLQKQLLYLVWKWILMALSMD